MSVLSRRDLLASATAAIPTAAQPSPKRPNILCIMVDEMR